MSNRNFWPEYIIDPVETKDKAQDKTEQTRYTIAEKRECQTNAKTQESEDLWLMKSRDT